MSAGRRAHTDPPINWALSIPTSVAAKTDLLLLDPLTNKPRYGSRSKLVTTLLRDHFRKLETTVSLDTKLSTHLTENGKSLSTDHLFELLEEATRSAGLTQTMPLLITLLKERTL